MTLQFLNDKSRSTLTRLLIWVELLLCAPLAIAQSNLGELLDAGAKMVSAEQFKQEVVQRVIIGPTASGGTIEVMYTASGSIIGTGTPYTAPAVPYGSTYMPVSGEWRIDDNGRVCTSMRISAHAGAAGGVALPPRCQVWLKYGGQYFISDSESDRRVRVFLRTVKP